MKLSRPGPCGPAGTPRISRPFKQLSRSRGQVTHVILTRSPLNPPPKTGAGPFDLHVLSTPPAFVLSQDQTLQTKPEQPTTNTNPRNQARTGTGPGRTTEAGEKTPTQPDTPQTPNPDKTTKTNTGTRRTKSAERKKTRPTPHHPTRRKKNRAQPDPRETTHEKAGPSTPNPPPTLDNRWRPDAPHRPPNPEPPATRPPHPRTTAQKNHEEQEQRTTPNPRTKKPGGQPEQPPHRRNPSHPPKPRTQNMTHYRDLKQHTHRDSTIRIRGPPPPGSARGASVSRTSEADSGPEPAVTGLLRLSSPRPPSGHWISPSPLGPERTLRTGGEAVKPRDGEPAHNAGPPSCPSCPGRFFAPAPRQGRRATARVRRPLRTSTTPPASSCSWAIGASSSSTLTLLR